MIHGHTYSGICATSIIVLFALFAAFMYVQINREKNNEHDPVGPFLLKVGLSVVLLLILAGTLSLGELGALLSLVPGVLLGLLWVGPVMNYLGGAVLLIR